MDPIVIGSPGRCAKQTCTAIVICPNGEWYVGYNWCASPQQECPRKDLPTRVGYEMCKDICLQHSHAEVDACERAGDSAKGATMLVLGHYYCCESCLKAMEKAGIKKVFILH